MILNAKIGGFMDFLAILGCDKSLYHSQGGATLLWLCDPDREFGARFTNIVVRHVVRHVIKLS